MDLSPCGDSPEKEKRQRCRFFNVEILLTRTFAYGQNQVVSLPSVVGEWNSGDFANATEKQITVEEVNRLLDLGRLLFSVLTPDEIEELQTLFSIQREIGNVGDS